MLGDVFENFRIMCIEMNELDPRCFLTGFSIRFSMAESLQKDVSKIKSLKWYVINGRKKVLEKEYVSLFIEMKELLKNTWKVMIKIKNPHSSILGCK